MDLLWVVALIALLVILIVWMKVHPFLAFLLTSVAAGVVFGMPVKEIPGSVEKGLGGTLGSLIGVICLGAMFGKLIAESGAAQKIAQVLMRAFGPSRIAWALMCTGFIVGIPLFYNVGFVLLVPLVFSVAHQSKLPAAYLGIAMLASLSVTHGFLPPHPAPTAMLPIFQASMSTTLIYGFIVAVPTMIIAGPLFARFVRNIQARPLASFISPPLKDDELPGAFNCFATAVLPVAMIAATAAIPYLSLPEGPVRNALDFIGNPLIVMLIALLIATYTLGVSRGVRMQALLEQYSSAIKDISIIVLIIAGAGALKQVLVDSGVSDRLSEMLKDLPMNPLLLGWLIAGLIRVSLGSATVAGLTAAGIMAPVAAATNADPNLMVLAIGAGSLLASHVNDSGFWMFKEYFNLSIRDTLMSWTVMETLVAVVGISAVLLLDRFV